MAELWRLAGGDATAANQVLYNLARRGIEWELLPRLRQRRVPVMAYSPIEQGRLLTKRALVAIAKRRGATPAQVALAWLLHQEGVVAIPKAARPDHVRENRAALDLELTPDELKELDRAFPPPIGPKALQMVWRGRPTVSPSAIEASSRLPRPNSSSWLRRPRSG
jgi:diketogulonate reductase-like aldo/keto reductase